jgi:transcription-repair coupling factor (superfamily II helicase)
LGSWTGQRFGVRQKERITSLKTTVDVLTLSATPIPRTLYLALSGFRDASLITTPPAERRPIVTHLLEFQPDLVKSAVNFELTRGGQVFYVVPRVKGIEETKAALESYFPHVGIAIAHGQVGSWLPEACCCDYLCNVLSLEQCCKFCLSLQTK